MLRLFLAFILLISFSVSGQILPDSIIVTRNSYINNFTDKDSIYRTEKISVLKNGNEYILSGDRIAKTKILHLLSAIKDPSNTDNSLAKYHVNANQIKNNPSKLLLFYSDKERIAWNEQQKDFIFKELTNLNNYIACLNEYLSLGCCYTMHNGSKSEYIVRFFTSGKITNEIKSRKFVWGYKMPWINEKGNTLYNYNIENTLNNILKIKEETSEPLKGDKLLQYVVNKIIDNNMRTLYKLSPYSYKREIDELNTDFKIISFTEVYGQGRYIGYEPKTMKIVLQNNQMLNNVYMVFMASKQGNTIYSRDSIKRDYKDYIHRIQSINFISNYLKANPSSRLDIYYFNNKGINDYNIEGVNKNPTSWAMHDKWIDILKWDSAHNIKLNFDIKESIKTSERNNCGCNYKFDRSYIEKAIFFEINDANNSSIWFLLPDNKVLFYIMDDETALNFKRSDFNDSKNYGSFYPCALFDMDGNRLVK
jgi:hypothetical protein